MMVDIVPPHARSNHCKPMQGFAVGDLATQAAIGRIVEVNGISNPTGISPGHAKAGEHTRVVEITKILAPLLAISCHSICRGWSKEQACLCDLSAGNNASLPLQIVLPLTMLREHVPSNNIRTFATAPTIRTMEQPITPPNPITQSPVHMSNNIPGSQFDAAVMALETMSIPMRLKTPLMTICSNDADEDSDDPNAHNDIQKEHLDAITKAEVAAQAVQDNPEKTELLYCDELDESPDYIE
jgi:hypothetical protein